MKEKNTLEQSIMPCMHEEAAVSANIIFKKEENGLHAKSLAIIYNSIKTRNSLMLQCC